MPETATLPLLRRASEFTPASFSEDDNSVDVVWTTGATVRRYSYDIGEFDEELVLGGKSVRMDRLNGGAPLLDTHNKYELRDIIGTVIPGSAKINGKVGTARVLLSRAPEHAGIVANIQAGVIRNLSVGYKIHAVERIEKDGTIPVVRVTDWEPFEISAVPVGADAGAGIREAEAEVFRSFLSAGPAANDNTPAANDNQPAPSLNHALRLRMQMRQRSLSA